MPLKILDHTVQEQQFVDNAAKLTAQELVGTWQWHGMKNQNWEALPPYTEIQPLEDDPEVLVARTYNPSDPEWKVEPQLVLLDTRLNPTLRLLSVDAQGQLVEAMNFTVLVSRWDENGPRMILKWLVPKGWLILWAKRPAPGAEPQGTAQANPLAGPQPIPGAAANPLAAPQPVPASATNPLAAPEPAPAANPLAAPTPPTPVPLPAQAGSLVGYWQGEEGEVLAFDQASYTLYEYNELVDLGSYSVSGNLLTADSQLENERSQYRFQLDGDTLRLQDGEGYVMRFYRLRK